MKILIIYDSFFGNTQKIAEEISTTFSKKHEVLLKKVCDFKKDDLKDLDLLIVGSPTRAFAPSPSIATFIQDNSFQKINFAVFDTRIHFDDMPGFVRFLAKIAGYADKKMSKSLKQQGGKEVMEAIGFHVEDKEGPLKKGEIENAREWAKSF